MTNVRLPRGFAAVAAALAVAVLPGAAFGSPRGAAPAGKQQAARSHPDTGGDQDCAGCHEKATPFVWQAWDAGPHGMALVKCQVCHGSTGKDFAPRPAADRCGGCHAAEVDSTAALRKKGVGCFDCHDPHRLAASPHRAASR